MENIGMSLLYKAVKRCFPADIYLFKVTMETPEQCVNICSKLTIKTPERRH